MKKTTEFGGCRFTGYGHISARRLAIVAAFLVLCFTGITGARAQATKQNSVTGTCMNIPANYAFTSMDNGIMDAGETAHVAGQPISLRLYPDPVSDYLLVLLPVPALTNMLVTVRNMDGSILATDTIAMGATNTVIDMKQVPHGTYVISIDDVVDKQVLRLVKN